MLLGASSYSDLLAMPEGISTSMLADRLRKMETAGLVHRKTVRRGASHGAYSVTDKGAALLPVLQEIARWGERHIADRWAIPPSFLAMTPTGEPMLP